MNEILREARGSENSAREEVFEAAGENFAAPQKAILFIENNCCRANRQTGGWFSLDIFTAQPGGELFRGEGEVTGGETPGAARDPFVGGDKGAFGGVLTQQHARGLHGQGAEAVDESEREGVDLFQALPELRLVGFQPFQQV